MEDPFGEIEFQLKEEYFQQKKQEISYFEENFLFSPTYSKFLERSALSMYEKGYISTDIIADYLKELASLDADSHMLIVGQNGIGKSSAAFEIASRIEDLSPENVIFSTDNDIVALDKMANKNKKTLIIDEAELLLSSIEYYYNRDLTRYIQAIRYLNKIYFACAIEYFAIEKEYRDHKVQLVLWLVERNKEEALGLLFTSFPTIGNKEDKFDLYPLNQKTFHNLDDFYNYAVYNISSFLGIVRVPKINFPEWYIQEKIKGAEELAKRFKEKRAKRKK
jgi:hypothetical protein